MAINWTDEQREAIETRHNGGSILVSAAAGSGKTAVLVERVISRMLNDRQSIDRALIVTFTEAAASEMRDKIIRRMYAELSAAKDAETAEYIRGQIQLSADADILTIDSFCLRVLKNNFYALGIDPDFRIADSAEAELLADDAADALFDRLYRADSDSDESKKFNRLLNIYATNRSDDGLKNLVLTIHKFIQSFPRPSEWLDEKAAMYDDDMENSVWMREIVPELCIRRVGRGYYRDFSELLRRMGEDRLPAYGGEPPSDAEKRTLIEAYGEIVNGLCILQAAAKELAQAGTWSDANAVFEKYVRTGGGIDSLTLRNKPKGIGADIGDWKRFCKARNDLKKAFFADCAVFSDTSLPAAHSGADGLKRQVDELVWLIKEFDAEFTRRKDLRNTREFSDIEHLVYKLFSENEEVRERYRDKYDEILIDEYQDTNGLQDSIFGLISRGGANLFMVGDLKQSIYRFRGGDPTIFKGKSASCRSEDNDDLRIDLSQNFRSRQEILRSVNDVFESVMSEELGDVNYAGKERIVRLSDDGVSSGAYKSEAHFVVYNKSGDDDLTALEAEAEFIADRIAEMINGGFMIEDADKSRPIKSRDICILSRSVRSGAGAALSAALEERGINSYVEIEDYFEKREVRLMMSLISVIDNNLQDIPLTAVMRSPIGGFSDNDLARIRIYTPRGSLFGAVKNYRADETGITREETAVKIKCRRLTENLRKWRGYVKYKSVANLIWAIYEETGLYDFMGALDGGEESQANLRLLYERAKHYEKSGFKGLFNFIRYIEKLEGRQGDLSSANLTGESRDVVRIMTIHKSKGLEFPVVFLAGMGKGIGMRAGLETVAMHKDLGLGIRYADGDARYFEDSLPAQIVREQNRREDISEAMRLLYVGMTRPKYKLITVASRRFFDSAKKSFKEKADEQAEKWQNGVLPRDAKSYADWIYPAAMRNPDDWEFHMHYYKPREREEAEAARAKEIKVSDELREVVRRSFEYEYEYPESGYIPAKTSVTALKRKNGEDDFDAENSDRRYEYDPVYMEEMPEFMRDKKRGTEIGTAHHQVMAYIDVTAMRGMSRAEYGEFAEREMERLVREGQLDRFYYEDRSMRASISEHTARFFAGELGQRVIYADKLYREQPFQIEIGANIYDDSLGDKYADEKVILQGVIDCFFENEDGTVTLLDYKTDRCADDEQAAEIVKKYAVQLRLYADAIERITGKRVTEKYLYLFARGMKAAVN